MNKTSFRIKALTRSTKSTFTQGLCSVEEGGSISSTVSVAGTVAVGTTVSTVRSAVGTEGVARVGGGGHVAGERGTIAVEESVVILLHVI